MNDIRIIAIKKSPHSVWFAVFIAFALLVVLNGPLKASPFPSRELLMYQGESYHPSTRQLGVGVIPDTQKFTTNGADQVIKLSSFVSTNSKAVADKIPYESTYQSEYNVFYETHHRLLKTPFFS